MAVLRFVPFAALLVGLIVLISCNDSNEDEKRPSSANGTAQSANQKTGQNRDADEVEEGEEGPATPATVAAEKPAPRQTAGKQFGYNFDGDTPAFTIPQRKNRRRRAREVGGHRRSNRTLKTERYRPDFN